MGVSFAIGVLGLSGLILSFGVHSVAGAAACTALMLLYGVCVALDLRRVTQFLARIAHEGRSISVSPWTTLGLCALRTAEHVHHQRMLDRTQDAGRRQLQAFEHGDVARESQEALPRARASVESRIAERVCVIAGACTGACMVAAVVAHDGASHTVTHGVRDRKKFVAYLQSYRERMREALGWGRVQVEVVRADTMLGSFGVFGVQSYAAVELRAAPERPALTLWFGYHDGSVFTHDGRALLDSFLNKIRRELELAYEMSTLRERAEANDALRGAESLRSNLLAQMSHDIRSPLNNIKAALSVLEFEGTLEGNGDLLTVAKNNCDEATELVEGLLDYTRHRAGRLQPRIGSFSAQEVAAYVTENYQLTARARGISLRYHDTTLGLLCHADQGHFKRVLANLISNALKYTNEGDVDVCLARGSGESIELTVRDTGRGMTEAQLAGLWVPFTRFAPDVAEGAGIGLSVCRILVEANGGTITIQSAEGRGTCVTVVFPAVPSHQAQGIEGQGSEPLRVLLVDDDEGCVATLRRALESYRIVVQSASTIAEALGLLSGSACDCIISDQTLPDGRVHDLIKALTDRGIVLPYVVLSGKELRDPELPTYAPRIVLEKPADIEIPAATLLGVTQPVRALVA